MSYILDLHKLEIGDVILTSEKTIISKTIRLSTGGNYSHAMIYVGMTLIHALLNGVYSKNPQRLIFKKRSDVKVLRLVTPLSTKQKEILEESARSKVGSLYSIKEAIKSIKNNSTNINKESSKQFCTRLVANCYSQIDIQIVNNPDFCTPEEIESSALLSEIDAVRETNDYDIKFASTDDPNQENQERAFYFLEKIRKLALHYDFDIGTMNHVGSFLLSHPDLDNAVCKHLLDSNYLTHYTVDKKLNPQRYDYEKTIDFIVENNITHDEFINGILVNERKIISHQSKNLLRSLQDEKRNLKYFKLNTNLYKNILKITLERILIIKQLAATYDSEFVNEIEFHIKTLRSLI